jgi:hypothetical protein
VEFLIQLGPASSKTVPIPRSLRDSPNYSPCWRVEVFEQYLIRIAEAKDQSNAVTEILAEEGDPFIRQMLLFHFERRCLIPDSIEYAIQCRQTEAQNRIQSMVKAMVIAGRNPEQIASEIGTDAFHIHTFEKLYFDVRRYLRNRAWLKQLCYPNLVGNEPAYRQAEARWLAISFERGWPGLAPCFLRPLHIKPRTGREELNRFWQGLLSRAADFLVWLEINGVVPSERDLRLLQMAQQQAKQFGFSTTSRADLDYMQPAEREQEESVHEAAELVKGISLEKRKRMIIFFEKVMHAAEQNGANMSA